METQPILTEVKQHGTQPELRPVSGGYEKIDAQELATRWGVRKSWIENRTRARTPAAERIPCIKFGKYKRFEWGSPELESWLAKHRCQ